MSWSCVGCVLRSIEHNLTAVNWLFAPDPCSLMTLVRTWCCVGCVLGSTSVYTTAVKWLVGYGGRRVTSKYRPKISPREDQIGECGSISFQGGPRGNMDARITPFGSHGVPLGSPFGAQAAISTQVYCLLLLLRKQPANTAPSPHQGP